MPDDGMGNVDQLKMSTQPSKGGNKMTSAFNETGRIATYSFALSADGQQRERSIISTGDIRHPWKSAYGFPMTAARLAAGQGLILFCREDEIFEYLEQLNDLLASPVALNQAFTLLDKLEQQTGQKLAKLVDLADHPLSQHDLTALLTEIEETLAEPAEETVADRLACWLAPDNPTLEISGLSKMLTRLHAVMAVLAEVKDQGFKVVVVDQRRQPQRPARVNGPSERTPATFLQPVQYHLTLRAYLVVRSDHGQSAIWN